MLIRLFFVVVFFFSFVQSAEYRHPVIIVPGSFCSTLEVLVNITAGGTRCPKSIHNKWKTLWFNLEFFEPTMLDCLEDVLTMHFDGQKNAFVSAPGVEIRAAEFGTFKSLLPAPESDFSALRSALSKKGYKEGVDMFAAPYEWRRAIISTNFTSSLASLVESAFSSNNNSRVHLIGHSTGGSMILYFLNQQLQAWKDKHIESMITLSGNFAGEVDNIHDIATGSPIISGVSKTVSQSWDFYAWLLPNPQVYGSNRTLIFTSTTNYTAYDILQLYSDLGIKGLAALYPEYSKLTAALDPPNVNTHCFYGADLPTAVGYVYTTLDKPSKTIEGTGDGMQDDTTNQSCKKWASMTSYTFEAKGFPGVHHTQLPVNKEVLTAVVSIVTL